MSKLSLKLADRASLEHRNQDSVSRLEKLGSSSPAASLKTTEEEEGEIQEATANPEISIIAAAVVTV